MNINTFTNYWGIPTKVTKAYEPKKSQTIIKKEFFNKALTQTIEKKVLSKSEIEKIVNISKALEDNYLK